MLLRTTRWILLMSLCAPSAHAQNPKPQLVAGPMVGYATETEVAIWVQTRMPRHVQARCWLLGHREDARLSRVGRSKPKNDLCTTVLFENLPFGQRFAYEVILDDHVVPASCEQVFQTQEHWRWRRDPPAFTVALGSCAYVNDPPFDRPGTPYGDAHAGIFRLMARARPDLMLWLGDNTYLREPDWSSASGIRSRYRKSRGVADLQPFLACCSHYAIWDDHDFGPNDSDWTNPLKKQSLKAFNDYWANPSAGLDGCKGVFFKFTWGDAEFFMLDDRYHRTPNRAPQGEGRTMLGERQIDWLLDGLSSSIATFKIVACGNQVLNTHHRYERMADYPEDLSRILAGIAERRISGVLFLSGDRHHSELIRRSVPTQWGTRVLYDFTCSPLLSGIHDIGDEAGNPDRVEGFLVNDRRNFGLMKFEGPSGARVLTLELWDQDGRKRASHSLKEEHLRAPQ